MIIDVNLHDEEEGMIVVITMIHYLRGFAVILIFRMSDKDMIVKDYLEIEMTIVDMILQNVREGILLGNDAQEFAVVYPMTEWKFIDRKKVFF
jgi:hypothetical protein